jgi:hypothetical protein
LSPWLQKGEVIRSTSMLVHHPVPMAQKAPSTYETLEPTPFPLSAAISEQDALPEASRKAQPPVGK